MSRSSPIVVTFVAAAALALSLSGCNSPICGAGTKQVQLKDGTLTCVPVDVPMQLIDCNVDGGNVKIVGGQCVSAITCDPGTTMNANGVCVGTGGGSRTCSTPATGKACVSGSILNFADNSKFTGSIHVELYNPADFLAGAGPLATTETTGGSYVFQDFNPPSPVPIIIVMTGDGTTYVHTATGDQGIAAGNSYVLDVYALTKTAADAWGFDYTTGGAYVAKFYRDAKPSPTNVVATETMPVSGVTLIKDGTAASGVKFFNATLTGFDSSLTTTGASGAAIVASPVTGIFPEFTGQGPTSGPITWEKFPGGSAPGAVVVQRFHPN